MVQRKLRFFLLLPILWGAGLWHPALFAADSAISNYKELYVKCHGVTGQLADRFADTRALEPTFNLLSWIALQQVSVNCQEVVRYSTTGAVVHLIGSSREVC
jgi:hypothetical protein